MATPQSHGEAPAPRRRSQSTSAAPTSVAASQGPLCPMIRTRCIEGPLTLQQTRTHRLASHVRFAVTAAGVSIEQPRTDRPARTVLEMTDTRRLPKPVANEWDWQLKGSCQGLNSSVFFHPDGERGSARSRRADRAKAICQRCPVLEQCRRHALAVREPYGVWGGLTEEERRELWTSERELLVS